MFRHLVSSYVLAGICYAIAAIVLAGFLKTPGVFIGDTYLLPSVAAVVLGGTALTGGVGNVAASAVAALFLTQLGQLALSIGAPTAVQLLIQSGAIAVGMGLREVNQSFLPALVTSELREVDWLARQTTVFPELNAWKGSKNAKREGSVRSCVRYQKTIGLDGASQGARCCSLRRL